jgi:hypothetical protein
MAYAVPGRSDGLSCAVLDRPAVCPDGRVEEDPIESRESRLQVFINVMLTRSIWSDRQWRHGGTAARRHGGTAARRQKLARSHC